MRIREWNSTDKHILFNVPTGDKFSLLVKNLEMYLLRDNCTEQEMHPTSVWGCSFLVPSPPEPSGEIAVLTTTLEPRVPPGSGSWSQLCRHSFLLGPRSPSQEEHLWENCTPCSGEFWKLEPVLGSKPPWQLQGRILFSRSSAESVHCPGIRNRASPGPAVPLPHPHAQFSILVRWFWCYVCGRTAGVNLLHHILHRQKKQFL